MMFGTRERFAYFFCGDCGTFQIADFPDDMARFYSGGSYYSFNNRTRSPAWKRLLTRLAAAGMVGRPERYPAGTSIIDRIRRGAEPWIAQVPGLRRDSRVLDVGCGEGARLDRLGELGFTRLTGVDPYLPADKAGTNAEGITLVRGELADVAGRFDLITMHHSLEHFPDPLAMLSTAREMLAPGGRIFVRIPLMQRAVWDRYGADWSQIDAPRHFYLFTPRAFRGLAERAGLSTQSAGCDGLGWSQAWSLGYARDVPMHLPDGSANRPPLSAAEIADCDRLAAELNAVGDGDQGWFVLRPAA
ncbi:class I SAM-dependent methyltransferase [Tsuneonella litorea]|nr:class I SAM-dependent methyltransferase [Tsuneonella litorea]